MLDLKCGSFCDVTGFCCFLKGFPWRAEETLPTRLNKNQPLHNPVRYRIIGVSTKSSVKKKRRNGKCKFSWSFLIKQNLQVVLEYSHGHKDTETDKSDRFPAFGAHCTSPTCTDNMLAAIRCDRAPAAAKRSPD